MHLTLATGTPALIARNDIPRSRGVAVVDFRTLPNGSYKFMKSGMRRGYWRVLELRDEHGSRNIDSHNVISVLYSGPNGIDGVTSRSVYCIDRSEREARAIAERFNATGERK